MGCCGTVIHRTEAERDKSNHQHDFLKLTEVVNYGRMEHCCITLLGQALVWRPHLCKTGRKKTQLFPTSCSSLGTPFQTTDIKTIDIWTACRQPCELTPTRCNTQWDMSS